MCSGSEAGSYLRLKDFVHHSTLGLRVIQKNEEGLFLGWSARGGRWPPGAAPARVLRVYMGTSLIRNTPLLGPYSRPIPRMQSFGCRVQHLLPPLVQLDVALLHATPYTLLSTPYTLHPAPYTLHPTPYTRNLIAQLVQLDVARARRGQLVRPREHSAEGSYLRLINFCITQL